MFRRVGDTVEVLLAHPGGPLWARRDDGAWSIPKGEFAAGEEPIAAALREFEEETGHALTGKLIELGQVRQPSGKIVHAWAVEGDLDPAELQSNTFEMEWPPKTGRRQAFPEIDRIEWFTLELAKIKILPGQAPFLDRLSDAESALPRRG
jgi:predicted NUDIX family NTP pyrophosphohydrolase